MGGSTGRTTCQMGSLCANVFRFASETDEQAALVEVVEEDACEYYREKLGNYYVQTKDWIQPDAWKEDDGVTTRDQKTAHVEWIKRSIQSVRTLRAERPELFEALLMWTGVEDFLEEHKGDEVFGLGEN
jgi:hypothetical protein